MSQRQQTPPTRIQVHGDDTLPVILEQIRQHSGERVVLAIPDHCPLLLTAAEFRTLKDVADRGQVRLALHSSDRLRSQLANMFGIKNINNESTKSATEGWRAPQTVLGSPRAFKSWETTDTPAHSDPAPEPTRHRIRLHRHHEDPDSLEYIQETPKHTGLTLRRLGSIVGVLLLLGLVALAAGWYYMPTVTVHATVAQQAVSSEVYYSVAAQGAQLPSDIAFTVPATQQKANVPFTINVPVTGVNRTPDKTASGEVTFRNPTGKEVAVPKGTELKVYSGTTFTTTEDIKVPAASGDKPGEAKAKITASKPGASGNLEKGMLTGKLEKLGVYYSNLSAPTSGGSDIEVKSVTQKDIDALNSKVTSELQRASGEGWKSQLPAGQSVVVPSIQNGTPQFSIQNKVGDQVDTVSAKGTVDVTGLIFDQSTVDSQAKEFFKTSLQKNVPEGYALDPNSVQLSDATSISEAPDNVQYRIRAHGTAYAVFDDEQQHALEKKLAGGSWGEAESALNATPQFQQWSIDTSPGWWPKRFPQTPSRVHVDVTRPSATPSSTPSPQAGS